MAKELPNQYSLSNLPNIDSHVRRVMQDMTDRINYLTGELDRVREIAISSFPGVDAARKERPVEGTITIPYRSDGGQDGLIRVSKDGVIASYVNPAESQFPYTDLTIAGNIGTGVDNLHSFTLPANTLSVDGDGLIVDYGGQFAANDDNKRVLALFDGTTYEDGFGGPQDLDGGSNNAWRFLNRIVRVDPTHVRVFSLLAAQFILMDSTGVVSAPGAAGYIQSNRDSFITTANLNTNNVIMKVQGESATATNNNVVQHMSFINFYSPRTRKLV